MTNTDKSTDLQPEPTPSVPAKQSTSFLANAHQFFEMAETLSRATIIPKDFQNRPANVFVALEMAHRLDIGPMECMQNLYVIRGVPSLSAKFLIGLANRSGRFRGGLRFREQGTDDDLAVTCYALDRETGDELSVEASMRQAISARWIFDKEGRVTSVWKGIPAQMLTYRSATFFVRRFCPEVMLGMPTVEEAEEFAPRETDSAVVEELQAQIDAAVSDDHESTPAGPEDEPVPEANKVPEYASEVTIAKIVAAFETVGISRAVLEAEFGDLEKVEHPTFDLMVDYGKALKEDGADKLATFTTDAALALLDAKESPEQPTVAQAVDEMFDNAPLDDKPF